MSLPRGALKEKIRLMLREGRRNTDIAHELNTSPSYVTWVKSTTADIFKRTTEECIYCHSFYLKLSPRQAWCDRRCHYEWHKDQKHFAKFDNMEVLDDD